MSKVTVEVLCNNIMLDEMRSAGWKGQVDQSIVDIVINAGNGGSKPRIKVEAKKKAPKIGAL